MSDKDERYQRAVDELAGDLLRLPVDELLQQRDFGDYTRAVDGEDIAVAFWHHDFDGVHHIVLKTERRVFLFLWRSYVNGVVFGPDSQPRLMTPEEAGAYD